MSRVGNEKHVGLFQIGIGIMCPVHLTLTLLPKPSPNSNPGPYYQTARPTGLRIVQAPVPLGWYSQTVVSFHSCVFTGN